MTKTTVEKKSSVSLVKSRFHALAVKGKTAPKTAMFAAMKDALETQNTAGQ